MAEILTRGTFAKLGKGDARRLYGRGFKYVVTAPYTFLLDHEYTNPNDIIHMRFQAREQKVPGPNVLFEFEGNILTVYPGYLWDGASGPAMDTKGSMAPSLMHDCAYQCLRFGLFLPYQRKDADEDFRELLAFEGFKVWHKVRYAVLRIFGGYAAKGNGPRIFE